VSTIEWDGSGKKESVQRTGQKGGGKWGGGHSPCREKWSRRTGEEKEKLERVPLEGRYRGEKRENCLKINYEIDIFQRPNVGGEATRRAGPRT